MKFGFAARLSWILLLSGIVMTGIIGLYAYRTTHELLVGEAINELTANTAVMESRLQALRRSIARDLNLLASHPDSRAILLQKEYSPESTLENIFDILMRQNSSYLQIRLIGAQDYGLEVLRVDRDTFGPVHVTGDDLQEKSHFLYVSETLKLHPGDIYMSPIVINNERGSHAGLHQPTSIFATPVVDASNKTIGVIVLNLDLNNSFEALTADLPKSFRYFLANQQGDYLIHPDSSRTFGFDRGQRFLMQDEFPATAALIENQAAAVTVEASTEIHADTPLVTVFVRDTAPDLFGENTLFLGVGQPRQHVLGKADVMGKTILKFIVVVSFAGVLLAVVLARYITRPINRLTQSVQNFTFEQDVSALPTQRSDEIGQLARSFLEMHNKIKQQFEQLQRSNDEMEVLAQHDALTGLFNRRKLDESLEQEFKRAQRFQNPLSVVMLDLDHFKAVNDVCGHPVGDTVLQHLSNILQSSIRETDILGRWGGEEFLIISPENNLEGALFLAEKLRRVVAEYDFPVVGKKTCSFGVACRLADEKENELIARADTALYQAKEMGRNRVIASDCLTDQDA